MTRKVSRNTPKGIIFRQLPSSSQPVDSDDDRYIALYHVVYEAEGFNDAAQAIFSIIQKAAHDFPGKPRHLYLDIDGHRNVAGGFNRDMWELQQEFCIGFLMPWLTELLIPMGAKIKNPNLQREDVPEKLEILQRKSE